MVQVDFQSDREQEENQAKVGSEFEGRHRLLGENGIGEAGDTTHDGRDKNHTLRLKSLAYGYVFGVEMWWDSQSMMWRDLR